MLVRIYRGLDEQSPSGRTSEMIDFEVDAELLDGDCLLEVSIPDHLTKKNSAFK